MGFIKVSHPSWNTLPRFVLLAGKRNKDHAPMWRLLCPITRNLVQVLFYDPNSQLFVSHPAIGRKQNLAYFVQQVGLQLKLQEQRQQLQDKHGDLEKLPARIRELIYRPLEIAIKAVDANIRLATSGIRCPDGDELDVFALSKKTARKYRTYYRGKSGVIRMTASAKKRLGIR